MNLSSTGPRIRRPTAAMLQSYLEGVHFHVGRPVLRPARHRTEGLHTLRRTYPQSPVDIAAPTRRSKSSLPYSARRATSNSDRTFERAKLGKPSKDFVPSHPPSSFGPGARSRPAKTYIYGGELTPTAKAAQAKKRYPNMFPPEGTFLHYFLSDRKVHAFIALSVLSCLAGTIFVLEFRRKTPYLDLLPTWSGFFAHPIDGVQQVWHVYNQHVAWDTQRTQLAREKGVEDARKRKAYRVAHGLERPEDGLQGGVEGVPVTFGEKMDGETAKGVKSRLSEREQRNLDEDAEFERKVKAAFRESVLKAGGNPESIERHREQQGKPKELKKWFGIW